MRKLALILFLFIAMSSCKKEDNMPHTGDTYSQVIAKIGQPDTTAEGQSSFGYVKTYIYKSLRLNVKFFDGRVTEVNRT